MPRSIPNEFREWAAKRMDHFESLSPDVRELMLAAFTAGAETLPYEPNHQALRASAERVILERYEESTEDYRLAALRFAVMFHALCDKGVPDVHACRMVVSHFQTEHLERAMRENPEWMG